LLQEQDYQLLIESKIGLQKRILVEGELIVVPTERREIGVNHDKGGFYPPLS
jgi:hypothetical protein